MKTLLFNTCKREHWLYQMMQHMEAVKEQEDMDLLLCFEGLSVNQLRPELIASLACMIEHFSRQGYQVRLENSTEIGQYLFDSLRFKEYWAGKKNFVSATVDNVFNLWRITDNEKEIYGMQVKEYLNNHFYESKDLSAVQLSITEACYNVLDHAQADGNAFSFIKYDEQEHLLQVAVCDFGTGIAKLIREKFPDITADREALEKAIEAKFTIQSKPHNGGMGLDNIRYSCTKDDYMTIISNGAFLISNNENVRTASLDFEFKGTLLSFNINISGYEDKEELGSLEFNLWE